MDLLAVATVLAQFQWFQLKVTAFEFVFVNLVEVESLINVEEFEAFATWIFAKICAIVVLFDVNVMWKQITGTITSIYFADMNTLSANMFSYTGIDCILTLFVRSGFAIIYFRCLSNLSDDDLFTMLVSFLMPVLTCRDIDCYPQTRNTDIFCVSIKTFYIT